MSDAYIYLSRVTYFLFNSGTVKCAYVNMSLSATSVRFNGSLQITLVDMNPSCCGDFKSLDLYYVHSDGQTARLANYDGRFKKFDPVKVPLLAYQGRLYTSGDNVTISPVKFDDEKTKYYFQYTYYSGASRPTIENAPLQLQHVYGM